MANRVIDYSNTIIYKISCRDTSVTDLYVGHTVDFVKRKYSHKQNCTNRKYRNHNCKVYQVIRANGGWENWKMDIIDFFECKDLCEAKQKEQEYFISLHATLNSIEPFHTPIVDEQKCIIEATKTKKHFFCSICKITLNNTKLMNIHNLTNKHIKNLSLIEKNTLDGVINTTKYKCEKCNFMCDRKPDWTRHNSTPKHKRLINVDSDLINIKSKHICSVCCKEYNSNVGLWKHKKKCNNSEAPVSKKNNDDSEIKQVIIEILKKNNELQQQTNSNFFKQMSELINANNQLMNT